MTERPVSRAVGSGDGRNRPSVVAIAATGLALLALSAAPQASPLLVWNPSPSSPRGLYAVAPGKPGVGDLVVIRPEARVARMAALRGYLPRGLPLVKTLAARAGDRVCGLGDDLQINGRAVAVRRRTDGAGRALPRWSGCRALGAGEVLLLGLGDPASFDGRYLGPSRKHNVLGRARLLWPA